MCSEWATVETLLCALNGPQQNSSVTNKRSLGSSGAAGLTPQGSPRKRVQFSVYNPDNDKECDLVKTFMVRTGAVAVDLQDAGFLEKASVELRVYIRRRHIPSLHRYAQVAWSGRWSWVPDILNPVTPKSDQFQFSPAALPEISHHTVWRT